MQIIEYLKKDYNGYLEQARSIIKNFHSFLNNSEIQVLDINNNNAFEFLIWGIKLIIKTEISCNDRMDRFDKGELNTYVMTEEKNVLVLSWSFDKIGNVNQLYLVKEFSQFYYVDLIKNLLQFNKSNNIKFQLI